MVDGFKSAASPKQILAERTRAVSFDCLVSFAAASLIAIIHAKLSPCAQLGALHNIRELVSLETNFIPVY